MRHPHLHPLAPLGLALALGLAAFVPAARGQSPQPAGDVSSGFDAPLPGGEPAAPGAGGAEGGFAQDFDLGPASQTPPKTKSIWSLGGFLRLDGADAYAHSAPAPGHTDWRGLSKLRGTVRLELSLEPSPTWKAFLSGQAFRDFAYQLRGDSHYTPQVLDAYQQEGEVREAWVRATPVPSLDVKVGRQIVVWGKSDYLRVTDVLNPIDQREPGLTSLEDLRLPVTMAKVSWYTGPWSLTAIAIPEVRFDKLPVPGSDYFPPLPPAFPVLPPEVKPGNGGGNTQWAGALSGIFSGWDLAFYAAEIFDPNSHVTDATGTLADGLQPIRIHSRLHMVGSAANVALGNWLLKGELARFSGLQYFATGNRTFVRLDGLLGTEYSGFTDTTLDLEASDRHLLDHAAALSQPPDYTGTDTNEYVASYQRTFLHDKMTAMAVLMAFGARAQEGTIQRYQLTYELARALNLTGGLLIYTPGQGGNYLLAAAADNDRGFFELKWNF